MDDEPLFDVPWYRQCRPRKRARWINWAGPTTTCDDCALLIGTREAPFAARTALWGLQRPEGSVGAYCSPHARQRGWTVPR